MRHGFLPIRKGCGSDKQKAGKKLQIKKDRRIAAAWCSNGRSEPELHGTCGETHSSQTY